MEAEPLDPSTEPAISDRPFWRTRKAGLLGGILAAAAILITATVVVPRLAQPDTVRTVRAFLAAARHGDPDRAIEIAGINDPQRTNVPLAGEQVRFLAADAMSDEWEVRSIEEDHRSGDHAEVQVTIAGPDGDTATATMDLRRRDDNWIIESPFRHIWFAPGPFWYADVNGVRTPTDVHPPETEYLLLPGHYRFYQDPPPGVDVSYAELLALPADDPLTYTTIAPQEFALTAAGEATVQRTVDAYIDACAQRTEAAPRGCPFGADPHSGLRVPEYGRVWGIDDVRWRVVAYPIAAAVPAQTGFFSTGARGLAIADRQRGVVELRATGAHTAPAGSIETVDFTAECEMITSQLVAGFTAEGTITVLPVQEQGGVTADPARDTCGNRVLSTG